jgi:hypothetical protein
MLVEEGVRDRVEVSVDGGVQGGEQALKLVLLGADRVGFGTAVLMSIGCSMLRQCHLAGPAARRHDGHAPPGLHAGRRHAGPAARRALHRPQQAHRVVPALRRGRRSASAWRRWA